MSEGICKIILIDFYLFFFECLWVNFDIDSYQFYIEWYLLLMKKSWKKDYEICVL
jgi:hypothetical protein